MAGGVPRVSVAGHTTTAPFFSDFLQAHPRRTLRREIEIEARPARGCERDQRGGALVARHDRQWTAGTALEIFGEEAPHLRGRLRHPQIGAERPRQQRHRRRDDQRRQHQQRGPGKAHEPVMREPDPVTGCDDHRETGEHDQQTRGKVDAAGDHRQQADRQCGRQREK